MELEQKKVGGKYEVRMAKFQVCQYQKMFYIFVNTTSNIKSTEVLSTRLLANDRFEFTNAINYNCLLAREFKFESL